MIAYIFFFLEIILQDHIERGNIDFRSLKFRVLDEADEMLRMGFVEDVELILGMLLIIDLLYRVRSSVAFLLSF